MACYDVHGQSSPPAYASHGRKDHDGHRDAQNEFASARRPVRRFHNVWSTDELHWNSLICKASQPAPQKLAKRMRAPWVTIVRDVAWKSRCIHRVLFLSLRSELSSGCMLFWGRSLVVAFEPTT